MKIYELGTVIILAIIGISYFSGALNHKGTDLMQGKASINLDVKQFKNAIPEYNVDGK